MTCSQKITQLDLKFSMIQHYLPIRFIKKYTCYFADGLKSYRISWKFNVNIFLFLHGGHYQGAGSTLYTDQSRNRYLNKQTNKKTKIIAFVAVFSSFFVKKLKESNIPTETFTTLQRLKSSFLSHFFFFFCLGKQTSIFTFFPHPFCQGLVKPLQKEELGKVPSVFPSRCKNMDSYAWRQILGDNHAIKESRNQFLRNFLHKLLIYFTKTEP